MSPPVRRVLAVCGAVLLLAHLVYWLPGHATRNTDGLDEPGLYEAGSRVLRHAPLYEGAAEAFYSSRAPYIYPPPLAVVVAPLAALPARAFQGVWYALVLAGFWAYAAGLVRLVGARVSVANVLGAGFLLQLVPGTAVSMSFGNADVIVWALCAWSLVPPLKNRFASGGAALAGVAGALKVFPGWSLLAKPRRDMAVGVGVAVAVCLATLAVVPVSDWIAWVRLMGQVGARGMSWHTNVSLPALLGVHGLAPMIVAVAAGIALRGRVAPEFGGGLLMALGLWLSPICWWHYLPVLLMPAASAVRLNPLRFRQAQSSLTPIP
jgi:hypothetical protein